MNKLMNSSRQQGYNILEVLMGIAIFAIGMLALASLQGSLTRSASDANMRTEAINVAESLIERRRGFARLTDPTNTFPAYDDITNETICYNRVGAVVGCTGAVYTAVSTVTDYWYNVATDSFVTTAPAGAGTVSDFKLMSVTVSWDAVAQRTVEGAVEDMATFSAATNACGTGKGCITLNETISSVTTAASSRTVTQTTEGLDPYSITYTPGLRPDIVSLNLGNNKFKESLTPEPDVIRRDELVDTRFDVITYSQTADGNFFVRREEFASVSCACTLKAPSGTPETSGRRPSVWAGDEYAAGGHWVDKPYGVSANNQQSDLCVTCCRDHHDGGSSTDDASDTAVNRTYPFRPSTDYFLTGTFSGDHKHYTRANNGTLTLATAANTDYVESCRLIRIDGFFQLAQDFRQEDLHVFPADFLDDASEIDTYSSYVTTAANDFENATYFNYEAAPPCIGGPSPCVEEPTYGGAYPTALGAGEFPVWTQLPLAGEPTQQLRSRGIYIDYLSYDMRTVVDCLRAGGTAGPDPSDCQSGDVILDRNTSDNILEIIPFFDVQLTKLERWNEQPINTPIDTTNEPLADNNAHSRGVASRVTTGSSTVRSAGHRNNLAFTDTLAIDPSFAANLTNATINVQAPSATPPPPPPSGPVVSGNITETVNGLKATDVIVTGLNGALCDRTPGGFNCTVPDTAVNPRVRVEGYGKVGVDRWACLTGNSLPFNSRVTNGTNAHTTWELKNPMPPHPSGAGHNVNVQSTACGA